MVEQPRPLSNFSEGQETRLDPEVLASIPVEDLQGVVQLDGERADLRAIRQVVKNLIDSQARSTINQSN